MITKKTTHKEYQYLLFDLDRTLWDFDSNSKNNISSLLDYYSLKELDHADFIRRYQEINAKMWGEYEMGLLPKEELRWRRFYSTLSHFGIEDKELAIKFGNDYLEKMPQQQLLMPYAKEILKELHQRGCKLALITNGFKEVQYKKLTNTGIAHYFDAILVSEEHGINKPSPIIFKRAVKAINANKESTIMVGDDPFNDIEGAMIYGIDQFFYNYKEIEYNGGATYESNDLRELLTLVPR